MNASVKVDLAAAAALLAKADPARPCIALVEPHLIVLAGTVFSGVQFTVDTPIALPEAMRPGADYGIILRDGVPVAADLLRAPDEGIIGGFHFAPGGNAPARSGGSETPSINVYSIWDQLFRPACTDPRAMTLIATAGVAPFWCDIYLTAKDHQQGTSRYGVEIADGSSPPTKIDGKGNFKKFDYVTADAVVKSHGRQLLSYDEFRAAAYGVTEKTAAGKNPATTGLDAPRTSRFGVMQATGNMWTWGHDGDPDSPRASIFGGSGLNDDYAGSRQALLDYWPEFSYGSVGARGRCDHLQPA